MRMFLIAASACILAVPAAAAPLAPASPTALQTVLKQGATATFVFEGQPLQLDTSAGPLPYSQIGTITYACAYGNGEGSTGILGWEAPVGAPAQASFGPGKGKIAVTTAVVGHQVRVSVTNADGGYYCMVRATSPAAEVP